jgi:3-deoxy-manno-octulosonate cytidylyltransferase (CMP-KDO synthetase)
MDNQRIKVVIPARLESSRLPGKVLADIHGHPMLWHVYQRCLEAKIPSEIIIATDSQEVAEQAISWGARAIMTSPDCTCGTDRIASVVEQLESEIIINVQGDEPLIDPDLVDELGRRAVESGADMVTPIFKISEAEILTSPTTVKVVIREDGTALYFSRSPVPFIRDAEPDQWVENGDFWLQVGTYAFRSDVLVEYRTWVESALERAERVEQLRFLEAGKTIQTFQTFSHSMAVDTQEDLEKVRKIMDPTN